MSNFDFDSFFPYQSARNEQKIAVNFVLEQLITENKKFAILCLGTGTGKSGVGVAASRYLSKNLSKNNEYLPGAYFLTTQKLLQEQYVADFSSSGKMKSLKSSSNYSCSFHKKQSCNESMKMLKAESTDSAFYKTCMFGCKYKKAKEEFLQSEESITNFPYFMTESAYSGKITPRQVLVIDESHNICDALSAFIEVSVSEYFASKVLKVEMGDIHTEAKVLQWIKGIYLPKLDAQLLHVAKMMLQYKGLKDKIVEMIGISKQIELLEGHKKKLDIFLKVYNPDNWVMNIIQGDGQKAQRKIEFKAIDVSPFANQYLFHLGEKIIMMSATILNKDTFCESLGIPKDQASFISIPSPFPIENRPIFYMPVGKMNMSNIDNTLPKLAKSVKAILDAHPDSKGIIHCTTYKIAQYLKLHVKSKRLLIHDTQNREEILKRHMRDTESTVLLSPSMTEGVDLKDDASRFQIICKVPFPYLGDKLIKKRMNKWKWWYSSQVIKTIIQSIGRSIRNMDDHAVTYILDEDWDVFYKRNKELFPDDFKCALK